MLRGLYTAATGMATQRSKMDVVSNNIVNAQTAGFKKDNVISSSFESVMLEELVDSNVIGTASEVGPYSFGTHVDSVYTDFTQGSLESTERQSDLAIYGEGFFTVETPEGERYTRSGNFDVDSDGYLVTSDGCYVLGENGRIQVNPDDFSVTAEGIVISEGVPTDTLRIAGFLNSDSLRKQGDNLYYTGETPVPASNYSIVQGALEGSNVDIADEIVDMMTVYRTYEASQKILTMTDETLGLAVNSLGNLR